MANQIVPEEPSKTNRPSEYPTHQELRQRLARHISIGFLSITVNNLRPFLEEYGWARGEAVLQMLAEVIQDSVAKQGEPDDHIARMDDCLFAVICAPARAEVVAREIIQRFDALIVQHYSAEAVGAGYFDRLDRRGNPTRVPLAGVVIAVVTNGRRDLTHPLQVTQLAAEIREHIGLLPGSRLAFDRRSK